MIKVVFNNDESVVYDSDGRVVNAGRRPQDLAFARNVTKARGYRREEYIQGHKRVVHLWKTA